MTIGKRLTSALAIGACGAAAACAASRERSGTGETAVHHVELLGFGGCPNVAVLQRSTRRAVERLGNSWRLSIVDQAALPPDDPRRGYGSPSVLVDGREVFGERPTGDSALTCRIYPDGIPDADAMYLALRAAAERR